MAGSLISPLAAGVNGCASGAAEIFDQGTSNAAEAFSDWRCTAQETTHALDANGGVIRYVRGPVDVVCKDSSGNAVRTFTWTDSGAAVALENAFVTGTSSAGQSGTGTGYRSYLNTLLTSFFESFGAPDGKVLVNNVAQDLQDVIGSTTGVFFNVVSGYDAVGDDSNNDTTPIQNAITAAQAAGGGIVYFPPGTYKINGTLAVSNSKVMLWAPTPGTVIKQYGASSNWVSITADNVVVSGLGFTASATGHTGTCIAVGASTTNVRINNCNFNGHNGAAISGGIGAGSIVAGVFVDDCYFKLPEGSGTVASTSGAIAFDNCIVQATVAVATIFSQAAYSIQHCRITLDSGSTTIIHTITSGAQITHAGNTIYNAGAGDVFLFSGFSGAAQTISEAGTVARMGAGSFRLVNGGTFAGTMFRSQWRAGSKVATSGVATTYTPDTNFEIHEVVSSGASMGFQNASPAVTYPGARLIFWYKNTSGGAITPTFGTDYRGTGVSTANNQATCYEFVYNGTLSKWVMVGSSVSYSAT